jgi:hypothetical protein
LLQYSKIRWLDAVKLLERFEGMEFEIRQTLLEKSKSSDKAKQFLEIIKTADFQLKTAYMLDFCKRVKPLTKAMQGPKANVDLVRFIQKKT